LDCDVVITVSMIEFLRTGAFGSVRLGMPRLDVEEVLGSPDDVSTMMNKNRRPAIWKYGDIELHFDPDGDDLLSIYTDEFDVPSGGRAIDLDPWILRRGILWSRVEPQLIAQHIPYTQRAKTPPYDDGTTRIIVDSGVELVFIDREDHNESNASCIAIEPEGLYAIGCMRWT